MLFSGSQFEPNSAFSGGGFMSSQPSQAFDSSSSATKNREFQGLVPLTVKQISEASQSGGEKSGFVINGVEVTNVTLVGLLCDKDDSKFTQVTFDLDDGTGRIGCKRWVNEAFDTREMEAVQDGMYVRLNGHLKSFQGKKQLQVFSARITQGKKDGNSCIFSTGNAFGMGAYHGLQRGYLSLIECIHFYSQGSKPQPTVAATQSQRVNSSISSTSQGGSSLYQTAPSNHVSTQNNDGHGRKNLDDMILDYLKQPSCTERQQGIHLDEISQQLKIPKDKLEDVIHSLESDGLIYSTIDEFHFKHVEI